MRRARNIAAAKRYLASDDYAERMNLVPVPPKDFRRVDRRCCANCGLMEFDRGTAVCQRTHGPIFDVGDMEYYNHVCDNWRKQR